MKYIQVEAFKRIDYMLSTICRRRRLRNDSRNKNCYLGRSLKISTTLVNIHNADFQRRSNFQTITGYNSQFFRHLMKRSLPFRKTLNCCLLEKLRNLLMTDNGAHVYLIVRSVQSNFLFHEIHKSILEFFVTCTTL